MMADGNDDGAQALMSEVSNILGLSPFGSAATPKKKKRETFSDLVSKLVSPNVLVRRTVLERGEGGNGASVDPDGSSQGANDMAAGSEQVAAEGDLQLESLLHSSTHHSSTLPIELQSDDVSLNSSNSSILKHLHDDMDALENEDAAPQQDEKEMKKQSARSHKALKNHVRFSRLLLQNSRQLKALHADEARDAEDGVDGNDQSEGDKPTFRQFAILKDRTFFAHKHTPKALVETPYDVYLPPIETGAKKKLHGDSGGGNMHSASMPNLNTKSGDKSKAKSGGLTSVLRQSLSQTSLRL